jgi:hypothetical protein
LEDRVCTICRYGYIPDLDRELTLIVVSGIGYRRQSVRQLYFRKHGKFLSALNSRYMLVIYRPITGIFIQAYTPIIKSFAVDADLPAVTAD